MTTPDAPLPTPTGTRPFLWPADYYCSATPEPVLPKWTIFGCAGASLLIMVVVFAGGAFLASGGFLQLMDFVFGVTLGEMRGMYAPEVTPAQKQELEAEIETVRKNLREEKLSVQHLNPLLQSISRASRDEKLTRDEVRALTEAARKANATARK